MLMSPVFSAGQEAPRAKPHDTIQSTKIISGTNGGYRKIGFSQSA
jgi:hypothetical protein